jgi:site-specific recombinase XerD
VTPAKKTVKTKSCASSAGTAGKNIERLKRFFNWCIENNWMDASPAAPLKVPKVGDTDVIPFDEPQVEKILKRVKRTRARTASG